MSPLAPESELIATSRLFLAEIQNCIKAKEDFAFETTLSGRSYLKLVKRLKAEGWRIELIYLALPTVERSKLRVAERVAHGGHNIPTSALERRFSRSLQNLLSEFSYIVDRTRCVMNTSEVPEPIFEQQGKTRDIINPELFQQLTREAQQ